MVSSAFAKQGYVYILTNKLGGTLYIGVTSDLVARVWQHKMGQVEGFTKKYKLDLLIYFEIYDDIRSAIQREKQMKKWNRRWKIELIEQSNPNWGDLYPALSTQ